MMHRQDQTSANAINFIGLGHERIRTAGGREASNKVIGPMMAYHASVTGIVSRERERVIFPSL